jgi:hypothetical protein
MAKKNIIINAVVVGTKNGGFARGLQAHGKENVAKLPKREGQFIPVGISHVVDTLGLFVAKRDEYGDMIVPFVQSDNIAIKCYQLMGLLAKGHSAEECAELATSKYDTLEHTQAYVKLAEALQANKEADVQLRIMRQSELSGFDLVVPEDVVLTEGQVLTFKDGVSEEGVRFANNMKGNYSYPVATRHNGDLYAKRPETATNKLINALASKAFNLVREIPNRKVETAEGVF